MHPLVLDRSSGYLTPVLFPASSGHENAAGAFLGGRYQSGAHPNAVLETILSVIADFGIPVLFYGSRLRTPVFSLKKGDVAVRGGVSTQVAPEGIEKLTLAITGRRRQSAASLVWQHIAHRGGSVGSV